MTRAAGLLLAAVIASPAFGQSAPQRRALLIANSTYQYLPKLRTPQSNVEALSSALDKMRFQKKVAGDLSRGDMVRTIQDFVATVNEGDFVLFYYSGYGYHADEVNFLLPREFNPNDRTPPFGRACSVRFVQDQLKPKKALVLMILLDASRAYGKSADGLDDMPVAPGSKTLIAFSAAPHSVAPDPPDGGVNPFTQALIAAMLTPGSTPISVAGSAQAAVRRANGGKQEPYVNQSLIEDFVFTDLPATVPSTGDVRVNPKDRLKYVFIRSGNFTMGCSPGDTECDAAEQPPHPVNISRGYWLSQTPVTQEAYRQITGRDPSNFKGLLRPVEQVTWGEAQAYCRAVGGRLPTEAEWEYAARAGDPRPRFGDLNRIAWYAANSGSQTQAVAHWEPNAWGLYDMLGNVQQWTADWYASYPSFRVIDPAGPLTGKVRILRGGSWDRTARDLRVSWRNGLDPAQSAAQIGFRCVGEVPPAPSGNATHASTGPKQQGNEVKLNPQDGQKYVRIPAGRFRMGCSEGDTECTADERPAHDVTLTADFWLGQTPVTQQAWQRVTGSNPSHFQGAELPVENVTWQEAREYCYKIGGRLPSEAEWEYAARAGDPRPRYGEPGRIAWYSANSAGSTHVPAQLQPNAWGLYDMLGNVWQWTEDWSGEYTPSPQKDPTGPAKGEARVARGAAWSFDTPFLRTSYRGGFAPNQRLNTVGVRCVAEAF